MPGIQEIADRAGVSPATVSRALRGLHHVNPQTRKKVLDAARALGSHTPDSSLVPKLVESIGVVTPYISRWFFASAIEGIERGLQDAGMDLLLYNFNQIKGRSRIFHDSQTQKKIEGMIVVTMPLEDDEINALKDWDIPVVLCGVRHEGFSSVRIDDVAGARQATQHLIDLGHKKIAIMSGEQQNPFHFPVHKYRKDGFIEALDAAGIEFNPQFEYFADFTYKTAYALMRDALTRKERPTAIFCESDEMAYGVMQAIQDAGLDCPGDISVIGFDNHSMAEFAGLTTIAQPVNIQGEMAVWLLLEKLNNHSTEVKELMVPTNLIVRRSTAAI